MKVQSNMRKNGKVSAFLYVFASIGYAFAEKSGHFGDSDSIRGLACDKTCSLPNTNCNEKTKMCECDANYSIMLSGDRGCAKPSLLGEQCFYAESCTFADDNAACMQLGYNAFCQCVTGYHVASHKTSNKSDFCAKDTSEMKSNIPALVIVIGSIVLFSLVICFGLKLFAGSDDDGGHYVHQSGSIPAPGAISVTDIRKSLQRSDASIYSRKGSQGVTISSARANDARAAAIVLMSGNITETVLRVSSESIGMKNDLPACEGGYFDTPKRTYSSKKFLRENERKMARKQNSKIDLEAAEENRNIQSEIAMEECGGDVQL